MRSADATDIRSLKSIGSVEYYEERWEHRPLLTDPSVRIGRVGFLLSGILPLLLSVGLIGALVAAILAGPTFR